MAWFGNDEAKPRDSVTQLNDAIYKQDAETAVKLLDDAESPCAMLDLAKNAIKLKDGHPWESLSIAKNNNMETIKVFAYDSSTRTRVEVAAVTKPACERKE